MRFVLAALAILSTSAAIIPYDLLANDIVITGGRLIDPGTGRDALRSVAIEGDMIVAIRDTPLQGDVVIDTTGHVVSPGFVMQSRPDIA